MAVKSISLVSTSPIVAAFDQAVADSAIKALDAAKQSSAAAVKAPEPAAPVTAEKAKLSKADREADAQQSIGACMSGAGEILGSFQTLEHDLKVSAEQNVQVLLRDAIKQGLTIDMLKAGADCYNMLVDSWNTVRVVNGLKALSDATRDNYLSRIRRFVKGDDPHLDLFGNKAVATAKKNGTHGTIKATRGAKQVSSTPTTTTAKIDATQQSAQAKVDEVSREKDLRGAAALSLFLSEWIEVNNGNQSLGNIIKMATDLRNHVALLTGAKK